MPGFPQIGEEEAQNKIKQNKQNKTKHFIEGEKKTTLFTKEFHSS